LWRKNTPGGSNVVAPNKGGKGTGYRRKEGSQKKTPSLTETLWGRGRKSAGKNLLASQGGTVPGKNKTVKKGPRREVRGGGAIRTRGVDEQEEGGGPEKKKKKGGVAFRGEKGKKKERKGSERFQGKVTQRGARQPGREVQGKAFGRKEKIGGRKTRQLKIGKHKRKKKKRTRALNKGKKTEGRSIQRREKGGHHGRPPEGENFIFPRKEKERGNKQGGEPRMQNGR